jgi:hypothetical protein
MKPSSEFEIFDRTMKQLVKVPHSVVKVRLDAEKFNSDLFTQSVKVGQPRVAVQAPLRLRSIPPKPKDA